MSLTTIDQQTRQYAAARRTLADRIQALEDQLTALKRRKMAGIKSALALMVDSHDLLTQTLADNPDQFQKPRTLIIDGIKVGYRKQKGKIIIASAESTCKHIHHKLPDQAHLLIETTEKPVKAALEQLSGADLKKIGVTLTEDTDQTLIKPTDSALDKLVDALIKDAIEEPQHAAA